jgi:hypothetical protein
LLQTLSRNKERTIVFFLLGIYLLYAFLWQDVLFYDESYYLDRGSQVSTSMFFHHLTDGPLYSLWFKVLSFLCPNPEGRYFLSWGLLVTLVATIPWLARIRSAWIYALVLLCIPFFNVGPYVSLFASMFFVIGLCLILRLELTVVDALVLSCVLCFLVAFCRPEFEYGVFIAGAASVVAILARGFKESKTRAIASLLLVGGLVGSMVAVVKHSEQSRSGLAFVQHYNLRASQKGLLGGESAPLSLYAYKVFHVAPRSGATMGEFFRANPRLFLGHVLDNAMDPKFFLALAALVAVTAYLWLIVKEGSLISASVFVVVISIPVAIGSLLVYPRRHYSVIAVPTVLLFAIQVIKPERWMRKVSVPLVLLGATALIVARPLLKHQIPNHHPGLLSVRCLRDLDASEAGRSSTMFDSIGIPNVYLISPKVQGSIFYISDLQGFERWTRETKPDWIVTGPDMALQYHMTAAELDELIQSEFRYVPHACPTTTGLTVYTAPAR